MRFISVSISSLYFLILGLAIVFRVRCFRVVAFNLSVLNFHAFMRISAESNCKPNLFHSQNWGVPKHVRIDKLCHIAKGFEVGFFKTHLFKLLWNRWSSLRLPNVVPTLSKICMRLQTNCAGNWQYDETIERAFKRHITWWHKCDDKWLTKRRAIVLPALYSWEKHH